MASINDVQQSFTRLGDIIQKIIDKIKVLDTEIKRIDKEQKKDRQDIEKIRTKIGGF